MSVNSFLEKLKQRVSPTPVDETGMWYQDKDVVVPSNKITMKGPEGEDDYFDEPIVGTGMQSGKSIVMQPGQDYEFPDDDAVYESKQMQLGGRINNISPEGNVDFSLGNKNKLAFNVRGSGNIPNFKLNSINPSLSYNNKGFNADVSPNSFGAGYNNSKVNLNANATVRNNAVQSAGIQGSYNVTPNLSLTGNYNINKGEQGTDKNYFAGFRYAKSFQKGGQLNKYEDGGWDNWAPKVDKPYMRTSPAGNAGYSDNTKLITQNTNVTAANRKAAEAGEYARKVGSVTQGKVKSDYEKAREASSFVSQAEQRKGSADPLDYVLDMVNPASLAFAATDLVGNTGSAVSNAAQGNFAEAGTDLLGAGLNALQIIPAASELRGPLKSAGKYLTTNTPLKNTYKYNPLAFKPNPEAYYRGIGRTGLDDALESGVLRPGNKTGISFGEDVYTTKHFKSAQGNYSRDQPYGVGDPWGDDWKMVQPKDSRSYMAEIPESSFTNKIRATNSIDPENIFLNRGHIPIDDVKLLKQDWLRGYEEIKKPSKKLQMGGMSIPGINGSIIANSNAPSGSRLKGAYKNSKKRKMQEGASTGLGMAVEAASYIPGPIGMYASGASALSNIAQGDYMGAGLDALNVATGGTAKGLMGVARVANQIRPYSNLAIGAAQASRTVNRVNNTIKPITRVAGTVNEFSVNNNNTMRVPQRDNTQVVMRPNPNLPRMEEGGEIDHDDDKEMVDGIASILTRVKDKNNRKQIANKMILDFKKEGVKYNLKDFKKSAKVMQMGGMSIPGVNGTVVASSNTSRLKKAYMQQAGYFKYVPPSQRPLTFQSSNPSTSDNTRVRNVKYNEPVAPVVTSKKPVTPSKLNPSLINRLAVISDAEERNYSDNTAVYSIPPMDLAKKAAYDLDEDYRQSKVKPITSYLPTPWDLVPTPGQVYLKSFAGQDNSTENFTEQQRKEMAYAIAKAEARESGTNEPGYTGSFGYGDYRGGYIDKEGKAHNDPYTNFQQLRKLDDKTGKRLKSVYDHGSAVGTLMSLGKANFKKHSNDEYLVHDVYDFDVHNDKNPTIADRLETIGYNMGVRSETNVAIPTKYVDEARKEIALENAKPKVKQPEEQAKPAVRPTVEKAPAKVSKPTVQKSKLQQSYEQVKPSFKKTLTTTTQSKQTAPAKQTSSRNDLSSEESNVQNYQRMLNSKYNAGLEADGAWGPKTQAAYEKYIKK